VRFADRGGQHGLTSASSSTPEVSVPNTPALTDLSARPEDVIDFRCVGPNVGRAFTSAARCNGVQSGHRDPPETSPRASSETLTRPAVDEIPTARRGASPRLCRSRASHQPADAAWEPTAMRQCLLASLKVTQGT